MVETPEAIALIDDLAAAADFLSIGSNDLTAALLGLDRRDPALTPARALEPVVRDAISATVRAGAAAGTPVSICGDAASDPSVIPMLIELGCRTLSVAPAALDEVRAQVRGL
jgi:phosphoenolpyruvate-protein kinase (PTS system EI component)